MAPGQIAAVPVMAAGDASIFLAIVNVLAVLLPHALLAVTLMVPLATKLGVYDTVMLAVPCPDVMVAPAGTTQL